MPAKTFLPVTEHDSLETTTRGDNFSFRQIKIFAISTISVIIFVAGIVAVVIFWPVLNPSSNKNTSYGTSHPFGTIFSRDQHPKSYPMAFDAFGNGQPIYTIPIAHDLDQNANGNPDKPIVHRDPVNPSQSVDSSKLRNINFVPVGSILPQESLVGRDGEKELRDVMSMDGKTWDAFLKHSEPDPNLIPPSVLAEEKDISDDLPEVDDFKRPIPVRECELSPLGSTR